MSENLDQQITSNVPEFFFIWDLESQQIIHLTQGMQSYARGRLTEDSDYEQLLDFIHPDCRDDFENILHSFSADHAYQDHDLMVHEEKYRAKWLNLKSFPAEDQQGNITRIVTHISDVTKRKEELSALENLNEKNESVIHILAHDLKGPINNILMLMDIIDKQLTEGNEQKVRNMIRMVRESGENMSKLVGSMLELMELSSARLSAEMHNANLVSLVDNIMESFRYRFENYGIRLEKQWEQEAVYARLDAQRFAHVVTNLLSNALKFTPKGGTVTVAISGEGSTVYLSVSDTGVGIPKKKQSEVFQEFSSVRTRGLHGEKSTGLGLSIVKKIVDLHQGEISVESTPDEGTTFLIKLPQ